MENDKTINELVEELEFAEDKVINLQNKIGSLTETLNRITREYKQELNSLREEMKRGKSEPSNGMYRIEYMPVPTMAPPDAPYNQRITTAAINAEETNTTHIDDAVRYVGDLTITNEIRNVQEELNRAYNNMVQAAGITTNRR